MPEFFYQCIIPTTHVVLDIRFAAGEEDDPTGLVVPVLAAEVEGGKAAPVLDVEVGPVPAEQPHRLAKPLPGRLVQGRVPVLQLGEIFFKYRFEPVTPRPQPSELYYKVRVLTIFGTLSISLHMYNLRWLQTYEVYSTHS